VNWHPATSKAKGKAALELDMAQWTVNEWTIMKEIIGE
jgi:hypothetical protein